MRLLILKDKSIPTTEYNEATSELKELYGSVGITIELQTDDYYWGNPEEDPTGELWEEYWGGYYGIKKTFLNGLVSVVLDKYGKKFDHVVLLIDARNFYGTVPENKVWGWNISAGIQGYDVQVCRFDTVSKKKATRIANSLGTMYHEIMHSHDQFPFRVFRGADITRNMRSRGYNVYDWDNEVVHGESPEWDYVRWRDNVEALKVIAPVLKASYETKKIQDENGMTAWEAFREGYYRTLLKMKKPFAVE